MEILDRIYRIELGHSAGDSEATEGWAVGERVLCAGNGEGVVH